MKREFSAGGVVFNDKGQVLLTQSSQSHKWGFPKGWLDEGETTKDAAVREVKEEGGVEAEIIGKAGESKYVYTLNGPARNASQSDAGGEKIFKVVTYFLMKYISGDPKDHDWEVEEVGWFKVEEALKTLSFSKDKQMLEKALEIYGKIVSTFS